ncbi:MAG TPA: hypothetical protein PLW78_00285 [bacterium]|nr:hypothetical protein [bacterium]HOG43780.1 hypothetical protein [bacterium]HPG34840.1 hypothetical protein [bacterium]HPM46302.1 hypothetical protein [bacterium]HRQ68711.1 hypothetical protein [bacterium]
MEYLKNYIDILKDMLSTVFDHTEKTCHECKLMINSLDSSVASIDELRESVAELTVLFQFGDIIFQSFESFDVIFDELSRLESPDGKISYIQAEKFSKLIGAVSANTFTMTGRTLVNLKENLISARDILCKIENSTKNSFGDEKMSSLGEASEKCRKFVENNILQMESSVRRAVIRTEGLGLFSVDTIFSSKHSLNDKILSDKLHEKIRVREHIEILNGLFPTGKSYSETGSLELF